MVEPATPKEDRVPPHGHHHLSPCEERDHVDDEHLPPAADRRRRRLQGHLSGSAVGRVHGEAGPGFSLLRACFYLAPSPSLSPMYRPSPSPSPSPSPPTLSLSLPLPRHPALQQRTAPSCALSTDRQQHTTARKRDDLTHERPHVTSRSPNQSCWRGGKPCLRTCRALSRATQAPARTWTSTRTANVRQGLRDVASSCALLQAHSRAPTLACLNPGTFLADVVVFRSPEEALCSFFPFLNSHRCAHTHATAPAPRLTC